ncbi:MAG: hypothetical protein JST08_01545 [Actinobacteria bacterium]|nr:hypothetical protein [Actinomycetota bacterium]
MDARPDVIHELDGRGLTKGELRRELESRFRPLRPASTTRLILAGILGPLLWVVCVLFAVFLVQPTDEILTGALVATASLILAMLVLLVLRRGRIREEKEYVGAA